LSGELVESMVRRARKFLQLAGEAMGSGDYDVAVFLLEQAAQLRIKALLLRVFGGYPRTHSIRELLGLLATKLEEAGLSGEAESVRVFAAKHRGLLWVLEDAYTLARYGLRTYERGEAENLRRLVQKLWELLEAVESRVAG